MNNYQNFCAHEVNTPFSINNTQNCLAQYKINPIFTTLHLKPIIKAINLSKLAPYNINELLNLEKIITPPSINTTQKIEEIINACEIQIKYFGKVDLFAAEDDLIIMSTKYPCINNDSYHKELLHQLIHWTGHPSRLNRYVARNFNSCLTLRLYQNLVAEIGTIFLCTYFKINCDRLIKKLKGSIYNKQIKQAMVEATAAFYYLIGKIHNK